MKALVYTAPRQIAIRDIASPTAAEGQAMLSLRYCGVCGTDIGIWSGTHPRAAAPLVLGHEFIGQVDGTSTRFATGTRVVAYPLFSCGSCHPCRTGSPHICTQLRLIGIDGDGGMAEQLAVDENLLFAVPDNLDDKTATLIEPLAVAVRAVEQSALRVGDSVLVLGAGPIGLLTATVARHAGAAQVCVSDINPARLQLAEALGFIPLDASEENVAERVSRDTAGDGVDVTFECAGVAPAVVDALAATRPGGTICLASLHKGMSPLPLLDVAFKELRIVGSRVYTREQFRRSIPLASELAGQLALLITRTVPLSGAHTVFDDMVAPVACDIKTLIDCTN
ncbi:zinc-dependent alcohol dehydrogenase [Granulosicoccus sp. 3-233]|uniref:zinc-dependent alcohol dehydrogenase n=1 Tax=Granulosicoccus sp. 3-233 TaxID=3417969 RepID=UPI003D349193